MNELILVLNCGSSSIKFALFDTAEPLLRKPVWNGKVDGIGGASASFGETDCAPEALPLDPAQPYHAALEHIRQRVLARLGERRIVAVAHRVVHCGAKYRASIRVDAAVLADLRTFIPLAPLHQPFALEAIEALLALHPELPQFACFDTAFHHTLPRVEQMLPLSHAAWERGLRRYGFHGLSYAFMSIALAEKYGTAARGRTIVAHLGSGASLCAMQDLRSVATTMGFSALDGLMMGTRCGALDPGVLLYLLEVDKLTVEQLGQMLYHDSGLLGLSGVSSDPRELLRQEQGNVQVQDALALYVRRIVREIGALVAVLGGVDMLVFTAGIGEHNAEIRSRVCASLGFLGVALDAEANLRHDALISNGHSAVKVVVEPTNEEWIAAREAQTLLTAGAT
ncbi:acetate/propionate family kinase [Herbaspirillum sp. RTI4]|uniref:acetate/propionate family kinase n=1 Tax=Herbaspirillum sp. RTI4 TaxID=3048640 RepID=UPI002AB3A6AD|nr:acetate/propionate family kinase [Herbaspirillum sp. RTI4]MDY7578943.1 acetate/propionate family kinase [Herbaspirillum sp. RTI4]MEA9982032.1 acetate/propionate family kinase [Herbaspirillum sp. RTI4]